MSNLGQYYTRNLVSELLISNINQDSPNLVLELGAGEGALIKSAIKRWSNADFIATDIDCVNIEKIANSYPTIKLFRDNSLEPNLNQRIRVNVNSIDVAVCNPPYRRIKNRLEYQELFEKVGFISKKNLSNVTSDLIFFAQNLLLLKNYGNLGIILPDTLLTGKDFQLFRENLLLNHRIEKIIQLPERIFSNTDAQTHIIIVQKSAQSLDRIPVYLSDENCTVIDCKYVSKEELVPRMDYKYHSGVNQYNIKNGKAITLRKLGAVIQRGRPSFKSVKQLEAPYIHTTNFAPNGSEIEFSGTISIEDRNKFILARKGDILITRVGRNCIGKVNYVKSGEAIISDCVYRISLPSYIQKKVFKNLSSDEGQNKLKLLSHGVCAKVISKSDLFELIIHLI